jgi:hypothetical protein
MIVGTSMNVVPAQAGTHAERPAPFCALSIDSRLRGKSLPHKGSDGFKGNEGNPG